MTDHPSTFSGQTSVSGEQAWADRAAIVPAPHDTQDAGGSVPLMRGTFAQMIRRLGQIPESERQGYVITKAGDRSYSAEEAMELASHPDFPAEGPG